MLSVDDPDRSSRRSSNSKHGCIPHPDDHHQRARGRRRSLWFTTSLAAILVPVTVVALPDRIVFRSGDPIVASQVNANFEALWNAVDELQLNGPPVGTIVAFGGEDPPPGWSLCDGSAYSASEAPELYQVLGTTWGDGSAGCSTPACDFNIPDLRGYFLRGSDAGSGRDVDANARSASGAGGATGAAVGTRQGQGLLSHNHSVFISRQLEGSQPFATGSAYSAGTSGVGFYQGTTASGDSETRPINVAVNYIIRVR